MIENRFEVFATTISRISRSLQKLKMQAMMPFGLRSAHVICVFFLHQAPDGLTASKLAALSDQDKGAVSRAVAELEKLGYITYWAADETSRKYRAKIILTETGCEIAEKLDAYIDEALEKAGQGITNEERAVFYKTLSLICTNLEILAGE